MNLSDTSGYGWQAELIVNCIYSGCSYKKKSIQKIGKLNLLMIHKNCNNSLGYIIFHYQSFLKG